MRLVNKVLTDRFIVFDLGTLWLTVNYLFHRISLDFQQCGSQRRRKDIVLKATYNMNLFACSDQYLVAHLINWPADFYLPLYVIGVYIASSVARSYLLRFSIISRKRKEIKRQK